ncbi:hypothetical protein ABZU02_03720 [Gardnerella piotii]|uniref:Uncharacterized protein n=1 Tax=Gardnerella piotii TaxID=2792977 RepID=A0AAU8NNP7_9BIFI
MIAERLCCVGQWESLALLVQVLVGTFGVLRLTLFEYWIRLVLCPFWELRANAQNK